MIKNKLPDDLLYFSLYNILTIFVSLRNWRILKKLILKVILKKL